MNNKAKAILAIIIVVIIGAVIVVSKKGGDMKNADMMDNGSTTSVVIQDDVEYFPGAKGYFVMPKAPGNYPGVVMIHENRGLRPEIRQTAETLAKEGFMVLAVDLLGGIAEDQDGARALTSKFNQATGTANMRAAAAFLRSKGASKIASLGWCFGGRQSIELAISGEKLDATVVYYGGGMATTTAKLAPIKWPVLGIFGGADMSIPETMVRAFEKSLNTLGVRSQIHIYPGVGHAFANPSGMNYAPTETMDAWKKTVTFLNTYLKDVIDGEADPKAMKLDMKAWNWVSATYNDGTQLVPKKAGVFSLTFGKDGKFTAKTDCNSMGGSYKVNGSEITLSDIFSTKMFCEGSQESDFAMMLEKVQIYHFTSKGELIFDLKFDSGTAIFR